MDWRRIYFMPHFPWTASAATVTLICKSFSWKNTLSGISGCRLKYSTVEKSWTIPTFFLFWARLSCMYFLPGHFQRKVFLCLPNCLWISYKWLSYQQAVTITFIFLFFFTRFQGLSVLRQAVGQSLGELSSTLLAATLMLGAMCQSCSRTSRALIRG